MPSAGFRLKICLPAGLNSATFARIDATAHGSGASCRISVLESIPQTWSEESLILSLATPNFRLDIASFQVQTFAQQRKACISSQFAPGSFGTLQLVPKNLGWSWKEFLAMCL